jgi:hypothetical protein
VDRYIELERRFARYPADVDLDNLGLYAGSDLYAPYTWKDLLRHRCTVVLGASGTGKSRELLQRAISLRKEGKGAFFCRLEDLADLPLASTLEEGGREDLAAWLDSADEGWFFLDAIDEAKLVSPRHFERAIRNFLEVVAPHLSRVHITISTRPHAWEAYGDLAMLCEKLGLRPLQPGERDQDTSDDDDEPAPVVDIRSTHGTAAALNPAPTKREALHVVTLAPLTIAHVRTFAQALGVTDIGPFMDEVERSNADLYVTRPADLPGIVDLWGKHKKIGSYSNVVLHNILVKLKDPNLPFSGRRVTPERPYVALSGSRCVFCRAVFPAGSLSMRR